MTATVKTWPTIGDYSTAVQMPDRVFSMPEIAAAEFATRPPLHLPVAASGANAVVFRATVAGATTAVRCFTREPGEERTRYLAFADHVASAGLHALTPPTWHDNAIYVADAWRPVVTMPWVTGQPLHRWVEDHLQQPAALVAMAESWLRLLGDLASADVAHGDLQHGNVLVDDLGTLRLIDFDGVWIPQIAHVLPTEWGHPNYQHPERGEQGTWGRSIDWFAGLVIDLSLRAVAADPSLWEFHTEENLIFSEDDYRSGTPIWDRLAQSPNEIVRNRATLLATGCAHPASLDIDLPTILTSGFPSPGSTASGSGGRVPGATAETSRSATSDWWIEVGPTDVDESVAATTTGAAGNTTELSWRVDSTGRIVTPWASSRGPTQTAGASTDPNRTGAGTAVPPDRQRTIRQQVNSSWDTTPPEGGPMRRAAGPPPPQATSTPGTTRVVSNPPPPHATAGTNAPRPMSFVILIVAALAAIAATTRLVQESSEQNVVLAVIVGIVLLNLVREVLR